MLTPALLRTIAMIAYAFSAAAALDGLALLVALIIGTVLFVLVTPQQVPHELPRYQLQHRSSGRMAVVAASNNEAAGRALFEAEATALEAAGARGQLVLVDRITGHPVTWQVLPSRVPPIPEPARDFQRASRPRSTPSVPHP